ncbi:MAG: hypothetical protein PVH89_13145 [Gammaproteobacteria bacterium]
MKLSPGIAAAAVEAWPGAAAAALNELTIAPNRAIGGSSAASLRRAPADAPRTGKPERKTGAPDSVARPVVSVVSVGMIPAFATMLLYLPSVPRKK